VITQAVVRNATVATMSSGFLGPGRENRGMNKAFRQKTAIRETATEVTKPALRDTNTTTIR
jgi:hypothetical protein